VTDMLIIDYACLIVYHACDKAFRIRYATKPPLRDVPSNTGKLLVAKQGVLEYRWVDRTRHEGVKVKASRL